MVCFLKKKGCLVDQEIGDNKNSSQGWWISAKDYILTFQEKQKTPFEVPPGCTKKDEILKSAPGAPKLYVFRN